MVRLRSDDGTLSATIGAVAIFPDGGVSVFGSRVESSVLNAWLQEHVHPIGLIELYVWSRSRISCVARQTLKSQGNFLL